MQLETIKKLIKFENIILATNHLQIINAFEFLKSKKINRNILIITPLKNLYKNKHFFQEISKIYQIENIKLAFIDSNINIKLFIGILYVFSKKKFLSIILGNYFVDKFLFFLIFRSKLKFLVDDGTSTLLIKKKLFKESYIRNIFEKLIKLSIIKLSFFTSYKNNLTLFEKNYSNDYKFLKNKIHNKKIKSKNMMILGDTTNCPEDKEKILKYVKKFIMKFRSYNIMYYPHPKEKKIFPKLNKLLKLFKVKIVKSNLPLEIFLFNQKFLPKTFVSIHSSTFIVLNKVYKNKLNLFFSNLVETNVMDKKSQIISKYFLKYFKNIKVKI
jgi:hypothetical protein